MIWRNVLPAILCSVFAASAAWGHKPLAVNASLTGPEAPFVVDDTDVSQVVYHDARGGVREVWLAFDGATGAPLFVQLGVPRIARLEALRPAFALVGPGLPEADLPFEIPEGLGALVFPTAGVASPEVFYEPFTGTESWQFPGVDLTLQSTGRHFIVGFLPDGQTGKFWVVLGERESFGIEDILSLPQVTWEVRRFHEVAPFGGLVLWGLLLLVLGVLFTLPGLFAGR